MTSCSNVTNACIHSEACMMDLTLALVRMPPLKLFGVDLFRETKSAWVPKLTRITTYSIYPDIHSSAGIVNIIDRVGLVSTLRIT